MHVHSEMEIQRNPMSCFLVLNCKQSNERNLTAGYSVVRSLSEAPMYAAAIAGALGSTKGASSSCATGKNSRAAALEGLQNLFLIFLADFYAYFRYPLHLLGLLQNILTPLQF